MALITTTKKLIEYIPALSALYEENENDRYIDFKQDLESANAFIKNDLLGAAIYGKLNANPEIKKLVTAVEAYKAAIVFIPQNDLTLTESGFAVHSTETQSPASKERVERLISTLKDNLAQSIESLQIAIEDNAELRTDWQGVKYCSYLPEHICNTNRIFSSYAMGYEGNGLAFVKIKPQLMQASSFLTKKMGAAFYADLIANPTSETNALIINDARMLFAAIVLNHKQTIENYTNDLLAYLVSNIADYPLFAEHYGTPEKWENSEDNRIVVFGSPIK